MRSLRQNAFWICLFCLVAGLIGAPTSQTARTRLADGFDEPVGKPDAEGYYMSRGFRARYHMGEDWNGIGGGNSDLGKPVYATANGIVVLARDMRMNWGNLIIIRHAFLEGGKINTVDSVYAHLNAILVRENQQIVRGQQVGTIGTAHGLYPAHLHFEIRKNIYIGFNQRAFARDLSNYYRPGDFISTRRKLPGAGRSALVAINTFDLHGAGLPPGLAATQSSKQKLEIPKASSQEEAPSASPPAGKKQQFKVKRFDDLWSF